MAALIHDHPQFATLRTAIEEARKTLHNTQQRVEGTQTTKGRVAAVSDAAYRLVTWILRKFVSLVKRPSVLIKIIVCICVMLCLPGGTVGVVMSLGSSLLPPPPPPPPLGGVGVRGGSVAQGFSFAQLSLLAKPLQHV